MQCVSPFKVVPAHNVEPGSIVVLKYSSLPPMVALTVQRYEGKGKAFLLLEPTAPDWSGEAGIFDASVLGTAPVLVASGARAVIPGTIDGATYRSSYDDVPPGALSIADGDGYVVAGRVARGTSMMWALDDGREFRPMAQPIWFSAWDVAVPDMNGKLQTLCTVRAPART